MKILTLTTDMGMRDHYVASLKGTVLKLVDNVQIVDITHNVRPFDVAEAAFHLDSCFRDFPQGTVHVMGVDSEPVINFGNDDGCFPSILIREGQYFVATDNGFFGAFMKEYSADSFWRIDNVLSNPELFKFPTKNILLQAAAKLLNGENIENIASVQEYYKNALSPVAISEPNLIKGYIIHFDSYGNGITNIHRSLYDRYGKNVPFTIYFLKKDLYIEEISNAYNEVPMGEKVAVFNENGYLEIAINRGANGSTGGAEQLFGLRRNDMVRIEFTPAGSHQNFDTLF